MQLCMNNNIIHIICRKFQENPKHLELCNTIQLQMSLILWIFTFLLFSQEVHTCVPGLLCKLLSSSLIKLVYTHIQRVG